MGVVQRARAHQDRRTVCPTLSIADTRAGKQDRDRAGRFGCLLAIAAPIRAPSSALVPSASRWRCGDTTGVLRPPAPTRGVEVHHVERAGRATCGRRRVRLRGADRAGAQEPADLLVRQLGGRDVKGPGERRHRRVIPSLAALPWRGTDHFVARRLQRGARASMQGVVTPNRRATSAVLGRGCRRRVATSPAIARGACAGAPADSIEPGCPHGVEP